MGLGAEAPGGRLQGSRIALGRGVQGEPLRCFALLSLCLLFALSCRSLSSKVRHAVVVLTDAKLECSLAAQVAQLEADASRVNPLGYGFLLPTGASPESSALGGSPLTQKGDRVEADNPKRSCRLAKPSKWLVGEL